ncbi:MAG: helix-turn-helix domain-containing protein [Alphaproteobacteria bacterium]|nr:helix-turn-helix domain-containing protein [Alphaproteobacteria bacterium]
MSNLSPSQLRAARALLNWSRADLASKAKVSEQTIHRFENGTHESSPQTRQKLARTFEDAGVDFTENQGVRFKPTGVTVYDGVAAFEDFHEFLYLHLKQNGGEVCLSIYDEPLLAKYRKDPEIHRSRMRELVGSGRVTFKILTTKSSWNTRGYIQFKWMPNQQLLPTGFYAFGDCLALVSFVNPLSPYVVVLQSGPMSEAYRQGFKIAWKHGEPPPAKRIRKT